MGRGEVTKVNWRCGVCKKVVSKAGSIWIDMREVAEKEKAIAAWRKKHTRRGCVMISAEELLDSHELERVFWLVRHDRCERAPSNAYEIAIERILTQGKVLAWTAHLMEKNWLEVTNWDNVCRFAAGDESDHVRRL